MKNKLLAAVAAISLLFTALTGLVSCEEEQAPAPPIHTHKFSKEWKYDVESHWHEAICLHDTERGSLGSHKSNDGDEICDECGYNMHVHTESGEWSVSDAGHCKRYTCCPEVIIRVQPHEGYEDDLVCDVCGSHVHTYSSVWLVNEDGHWHKATCEHTDAKVLFGKHTGMDDCRCDVCGYESHPAEEAWSSDRIYHWHESTCSHDRQVDKAKHVVEDEYDEKCSICGASTKIELPALPV